MIESYWNSLWEYHTVKVVKIQDWKPRAFCISFLFTTMTIGIWFVVIANHGYCELHTLFPTEYVEHTQWEEGDDWKEKFSKSWYAGGPPSYCNDRSTDYIYDKDWHYVNNKCAFDVPIKDIRTQHRHRLSIPTSLGVFDPNMKDEGHKTVVFIPNVEYLDFSHSIRVIENGKKEISKFQLEVQDAHGKFRDKNDVLANKTNPAATQDGTKLVFNLKGLLSMMNVTLEDNNVINNTNSSNIDEYGRFPTYRVTGYEIRITLETSNFKFQDHLFDFGYKTKVKVAGLPQKLKGHDQVQWYETWSCDDHWRPVKALRNISEEFYPCGISVNFFVVPGQVCHPSPYAIFRSIIQMTVLFSIATLVVDNIFQFFNRSFRIAKTTTDILEWTDHHKNKPLVKKVEASVGRLNYQRALERGDTLMISTLKTAHSPDPLDMSPLEIMSGNSYDSEAVSPSNSMPMNTPRLGDALPGMYEVMQDVDITEDVEGKKKTRTRALKGRRVNVLEVSEVNECVRGKLENGWIHIRGIGDRHWTFAKPVQKSNPIDDEQSVSKFLCPKGHFCIGAVGKTPHRQKCRSCRAIIAEKNAFYPGKREGEIFWCPSCTNGAYYCACCTSKEEWRVNDRVLADHSIEAKIYSLKPFRIRNADTNEQIDWDTIQSISKFKDRTTPAHSEIEPITHDHPRFV